MTRLRLAAPARFTHHAAAAAAAIALCGPGAAFAFPAVMPLASMSCSAGTRANGLLGTDTAAVGDKLGTAAVAAGDFNGDGIADLALGAPADGSGRPGAVYVVFGRAGGLPCPLDLTAPGVLRIDGSAADGQFGAALAAADVNGDGLTDLLIGAPGESAVYVLAGQRGAWPASVGSGAALRLAGPAGSGAGLGLGAGDVNGDGIADVLVGTAVAAPAAGYVVFGRPGLAALDLATLDGSNGYALTGATAAPGGSFTPAAVGDVNGDGIGDLLLGAPDAASAYLVFGRRSPGAANVDVGNAALATRVTGPAGSAFGFAAAGLGDLNGDGLADFAIGAPLANLSASVTQAGRTYVVFGRTAFPATLDATTLAGSGGFVVSGAAVGDRSGWSVAGAGDVNGDGRPDLLIGAPYSNYTARAAGAAYVVFGQAGLGSNVSLAGGLNGSNGFQMSGVAAGDLTGYAVARAGDVNAAGAGDIVVGARNAQLSRGSAFVVYGTGVADTTPPLIVANRTPAANAAGWNRSSVTVSFSCSDAQTGIASCSAPRTLATEGANQSVTGTAVDGAGNSASTTVAGINLDFTPPVVAVTGVVAGKTYATAPKPACSAQDALSGVAVAPTLQVVPGTPSGNVTPYTATCSGAQDRADNVAAPASVSYAVRSRR